MTGLIVTLIGLGLQLEPKAVQYLPEMLKILMTSGLLPAALIAIVLNLILPKELATEATEEASPVTAKIRPARPDPGMME